MTRQEKKRQAELRGAPAPKSDAAGQFGETEADPNANGVSSANPVVLSGDGDATPGGGHGRDRADDDDEG